MPALLGTFIKLWYWYFGKNKIMPPTLYWASMIIVLVPLTRKKQLDLLALQLWNLRFKFVVVFAINPPTVQFFTSTSNYFSQWKDHFHKICECSTELCKKYFFVRTITDWSKLDEGSHLFSKCGNISLLLLNNVRVKTNRFFNTSIHKSKVIHVPCVWAHKEFIIYQAPK